MVSKTSSNSCAAWCATGNTPFGRENPKTRRSPIANQRSVAASRGPRNAEVGSDLLEAVDDLRIQRDSLFAELLHPREALLSVQIDSILTVRLRTLLQLAREPVHVPPDLLARPDRGRVEGHEEVPDVRLLLVRVDLQPGRRAAADAAEDADHQSQSVSLVTAETL